MTTLEREERFDRACRALAGLRDLLASTTPGTAIDSQRIGGLVELIEADLHGGNAFALHHPTND